MKTRKKKKTKKTKKKDRQVLLNKRAASETSFKG